MPTSVASSACTTETATAEPTLPVQSNSLFTYSLVIIILWTTSLIIEVAIIILGCGTRHGIIFLLTGLPGCLAYKKPLRSLLNCAVVFTSISTCYAVAAAVLSAILFHEHTRSDVQISLMVFSVASLLNNTMLLAAVARSIPWLMKTTSMIEMGQL